MGRDGLARALRASTFPAAMAVLLAIPASAGAAYAQRTLATGSQGRDVKLLQRYLTRAGFRATADGEYGAQTERAQRRFERSEGRRADGRATPGDQRLVRHAATSREAQEGDSTGDTGGGNPSDRAVMSSDGRTA